MSVGLLYFLGIWNAGTWIGVGLCYWQWRHRGVGRDFVGAFLFAVIAWPLVIPGSLWLLAKSFWGDARFQVASSRDVAGASGRRKSRQGPTMG